MSTSKHINVICIAAACVAVLLMLLMFNAEKLGVRPVSSALAYPSKLFDTSTVHTIDIIMEDWDSFITTCENEEYAACDVVIDGETSQNVGIRAKGNTSLSTVSSLGSDRYSFKIEFDQYANQTYHGLDKLSLNNVIQDNTYMKDYLTYRLMGEFGVAAPLCSFAYITVNGEDWGLYLAVEAVEDSFLQRNFGKDYGELYKPDSLSMGGRPGNGQGFNFDMEQLMQDNSENTAPNTTATPTQPDARPSRGGFPGQNAAESDTTAQPGTMTPPSFPGEMPTDGTIPQFPGETPTDSSIPTPPGRGDDGRGMGGGMGEADVKLQYIDDSPSSYANIFDNAKTDVTAADQTRLIAALQQLSSGGDIAAAVDIERTLRYFVVHNFVVNADSYTGSMVHNYYLYEDDGRLSMIPWDYNLAFGTFQGGSAANTVNDPIDTPLSVNGNGDRPMADWIFSSEEYTALYHEYFADFLSTVDVTAIIDEADRLIAPYVAQDPSSFCTYEEYTAGVTALREFCSLRAASVQGQLDGTIPSTSDGQAAQPTTLISTDGLTLSDMGTMSHGGRPDEDMPGNMPQQMPEGFTPPDDMTPPTGFEPSSMPAMPTDSSTTSDTNEQTEATKSSAAPTNTPTNNTANRTPGNMNSSRPNTGDTASTSPLLLGISLAALAAGLLIACKFKR